MIGLGPGFFFLLQKALQAGRLVASQPALTLSNPVVSVVFGVAVFDEHLRPRTARPGANPAAADLSDAGHWVLSHRWRRLLRADVYWLARSSSAAVWSWSRRACSSIVCSCWISMRWESATCRC